MLLKGAASAVAARGQYAADAAIDSDYVYPNTPITETAVAAARDAAIAAITMNPATAASVCLYESAFAQRSAL